MPRSTGSARDLRQEVTSIWDANADFWDEKMGEGNVTHRQIVGPVVERLLEVQPGDRVLDLACGNGQLSRALEAKGATVLACDASGGMLRHARRRTSGGRRHIEYRQIDLSDPKELRFLPADTFQSAVCNMALMDIPDIQPLAKALPGLLVRGGRFVLSVTHPVFNSTGSRRVLEEDSEVTGPHADLVQRSGVFVYRYGRSSPTRGLAIVGQPRAQYYFDRSLTELLQPFLAAGLLVDAFEELSSPSNIPGSRTFGWSNFPEIPPFLAVRLLSPGPKS